MKRQLLLILAAVVRHGDEHFRLIKYSEFPPLSLMTLAGLTPEQLEEGYLYARRQFATFSSIFHRSLGLPGALKRIAYNVAWMKIDPFWVAIIRAGLMPFASHIFERILQLSTKVSSEECVTVPWHVNTSLREQVAPHFVLDDPVVNRHNRGHEGDVSCESV